MHRSGQLAFIKTTLSVVPVYTSISVGLLQWMHKALQKSMRAFLWTGTDVVQNGKCLVAWNHIQRPLQLGGLGFLISSGWEWHFAYDGFGSGEQTLVGLSRSYRLPLTSAHLRSSVPHCRSRQAMARTFYSGQIHGSRDLG
jgi:hypothetical protein